MRHLLPTLALVAFFLVGCANQPAAPVNQADAITQIQQLGGRISRDSHFPDKPVIAINFSDAPITDASLSCLAAFPHLQKLDLGHSGKFNRPTLTDAALPHLEKLTQLRRLSLTRTAITDTGLKHLQHLTNLESLNLEHTKITDAGLKYLTALPKLQRLKLAGTRVTKEAIANLQTSLPNCTITF